MTPNPELESYKDAVWDFMLEHCDLTERGSLFVKFHASDRRNFENRIKARWKYDYHRKDERSNFNNRQKEIDATARKQAHLDRKESKRRQHMLAREERIKALKEVEEFNAKQVELAKIASVSPVIPSERMQPLALWWYNIKQLWKQHRHKKLSSVLTANFSSEKQKQG